MSVCRHPPMSSVFCATFWCVCLFFVLPLFSWKVHLRCQAAVPLNLDHRACTAALALALLSSAVILAARAGPPFSPPFLPSFAKYMCISDDIRFFGIHRLYVSGSRKQAETLTL